MAAFILQRNRSENRTRATLTLSLRSRATAFSECRQRPGHIPVVTFAAGPWWTGETRTSNSGHSNGENRIFASDTHTAITIDEIGRHSLAGNARVLWCLRMCVCLEGVGRGSVCVCVRACVRACVCVTPQSQCVCARTCKREYARMCVRQIK